MVHKSGLCGYDNVINRRFGNGPYQLSIVMTGGWFIVAIPTLFVEIHICDFMFAGSRGGTVTSALKSTVLAWSIGC